MTNNNAPWINHLVELRSRAIGCVSAYLVLVCAAFPFYGAIYDRIAAPILSANGQSVHLLVVDPVASFLVPMKMSFILAFLILMPLFLYHFWAFLSPALYRSERRRLLPLFFLSTGLFYAGFAFGYFVACPMALRFFLSVTPESAEFMPDIQHYLSFVSRLCFGFGFGFQLPTLIRSLITFGWMRVETIRAARPYVIVGCFILGMVLTPPDIISQICLALPLWALFELSLIRCPENRQCKETFRRADQTE